VVPSSQNGALALLDLALTLVVVVAHALLTLDLMAASGSTLLPATIVKTPTPTTTLDFPTSRASVELLVPSASKALLVLPALPLRLLSASSTLAVAPEAALNSLFTSAARVLFVRRLVRCLSVGTRVLLPALTLWPGAALLVRRHAPVTVWVEVLVTVVFASVTRATRVLTVLSLPN